MSQHPDQRVFAMLAAGGTGGHVYPAVAVAQALVASGHAPRTIRFVTERRELSTTAIAQAGFELDVIALQHGFERKLSFTNARRFYDLIRSFAQSLRLVRRYRPSVVLGFGAYVSLPLVVAARFWRVPVVVHEQNAFPGMANRIAVRLGAKPAVSLPGTSLTGAVLTGNPVRPAVAAVTRQPSIPPVVVFVGGSLGSGVLDRAALELYERWRNRRDVRIVHISGERSFTACAASLEGLRRTTDVLDYDLVAYEHDMPARYRSAAVIVSRAGGMVAELAAAGVPSVLIPWAQATERHQHANALAMVDAGASILIDETELTAVLLDETLTTLLHDADRLEKMQIGARLVAKPNAAAAVAELARCGAKP